MVPQSQDPRSLPRLLAEKAIAEGDPLAWFERFYRLALAEGYPIPWADMKPNPNLMELCERIPDLRSPTNLLVVGCGLGDDAEWLAQQGHEVTAFDISPSAITHCCRRFPDSPVDYLVADLFDPPESWRKHFKIVLESYTLQVFKGSLRNEAVLRISELISPSGLLVLISRGRNESESAGTMPWPLTRDEVDVIPELGFRELFFEDYLDRSEERPIRRFRACYQKL